MNQFPVTISAGADLTGADLIGSTWSSVNVAGSDFTAADDRAYDGTPPVMENAIGPAGFEPPTAVMVIPEMDTAGRAGDDPAPIP